MKDWFIPSRNGVAVTRKALCTLVGIENLEQRWDGEGDLIDRDVVEYLRYHYLDP